MRCKTSVLLSCYDQPGIKPNWIFQAGLAVIDGSFDIIPLIKDPEAAAKLLEKQTPNWEPGT